MLIAGKVMTHFVCFGLKIEFVVWIGFNSKWYCFNDFDTVTLKPSPFYRII